MNTYGWFHGHLHISQYSRHISGHDSRPTAHVIYGGVDIVRFSPAANIPKEPLAVFVGRLIPHKGVHDLIEALPAGMKLEVIGRPYDESYFADLKRLAADKPVCFRQDCDDAEIVRAYRRAACVVLPSVYHNRYQSWQTKVPELLGQTLIEGMACGTAAPGTTVASLPEVVADGVTGYVVAPNDSAALREKLEYLRDNLDVAAAMGNVGRQRVLDASPGTGRCSAVWKSTRPGVPDIVSYSILIYVEPVKVTSPLAPVLGGEGLGVRGLRLAAGKTEQFPCGQRSPLTPNPSPPSTGARGS